MLHHVTPGLRETQSRAAFAVSRFSFHRCLDCHDISRLPHDPDKGAKRGKFADTSIRYVHIDISELRLATGKFNIFLAIDRVSKFTYVEFRDDAGKMNGAEFLRGVVQLTRRLPSSTRT